MSGRRNKNQSELAKLQTLERQVAALEPLRQLVQSGELNVIQQSLEVVRTSGPIPDPDTLARYDRVSPGFGDAFLKQFLAESQHRMDLEKKDLAKAHELFDKSANLPYRGLVIATVFGLLVLFLAAWAMVLKAFVVVGICVAAVATIIAACNYSKARPDASKPTDHESADPGPSS